MKATLAIRGEGYGARAANLRCALAHLIARFARYTSARAPSVGNGPMMRAAFADAPPGEYLTGTAARMRTSDVAGAPLHAGLMCGRASLASMPGELLAYLQPRHIHDVPPWYEPSYNVAPSQSLFAIRESPDGREACPLRWGLVPSWAREPDIGMRMINARAETVASRPAYRDAFRTRATPSTRIRSRRT